MSERRRDRLWASARGRALLISRATAYHLGIIALVTAIALVALLAIDLQAGLAL